MVWVKNGFKPPKPSNLPQSGSINLPPGSQNMKASTIAAFSLTCIFGILYVVYFQLKSGWSSKKIILVQIKKLIHS